MKIPKYALGLACLFVISTPGFGQDVNLVTRFAAWNDPAAWSDGAAAGAGKNYVVDATGQDLTSPRTFGPVFRGDSLNLQSDGNLELRHLGGSTNIPSLTLSGGAITHGTGRTVGVGGAAQVINVTGDSRIVVVRNSQTLEVRSRLTGAGGLTALGGSVEPGTRATIALLGIGSDYTGAWTVENVTLQAVTPSSMGSGNVLITEGTLDFDYRHHNLAGRLTIDGTESRLNLDQDIAFSEVFFGTTKLPDGVHPWSFFDDLQAGEQILDGGGRLIIGDQDADDDGMTDVLETELFGDTSKSANGDEDGDGLSNLAELTGNSDPTKADTDGDGLTDDAEVAAGSDPNIADTDGDGLTDTAEVTTNQTNPRSADTDGDSVSDGDEVTNGTNPLLADSDGDGFDDGTELGANSDANDANDKPGGSFIPAEIEAGNPVLLPVVFGGGDAIATTEANMALNTREPEILFVTTATDGTGLTDPVTGEEPQEAVVGFFMDPRTLEQTRDPFVILGNPDGELKRLDVKYNPVSGQYVVVSGAQGYRPNSQVVPLIALVNPNSVAGADSPVAKAFAYDGDTPVSYDDVAVAVSTNNGNILVVAEYKFDGEGEGVVGAMFDSDGAVLTPTFTRLDRLQATGDEDDPDVLFLPKNDAFVFLVNTDGDAAPDLLDRITGSVISSTVNADGSLQLGDQVVLGADRKEGVAEGHAAAIENPFTNELIGAFDYDNGAQGGDIFYFQVGTAPEFQLTTTREQIPYLEAEGSNPYAQRHPQLAADPNSGVIVVGHHVRSSAADPPLPNGYALTALGPDGAVLPGRSEDNRGFHAFVENEADTDNDANWTNVKYDPISDSLIVVFADSGGETKVVRFTVISNHLEQETEAPPAEPGTLPADSVADFGGPEVDNGWSYGYRNVLLDNRTDDYDPVADFIQFPDDWWIGGQWDEPNADGDNVPWTSIGATNGHPNGDNNGELHWTIRRWTSPGGPLDVTWAIAKQNVNCGNGVTGGLHHNGVRIDSETLAFDDAMGVERTVFVETEAGDVIDLIHSPFGTDDTDNDGCDGALSSMSIVIGNPPPPAEVLDLLVLGADDTGEAGADANVLAFLREEFGADNIRYMNSGATDGSETADVIIMSSTFGSGSVRGKFHNSAVPIVNWEEAIMDGGDGEFGQSVAVMTKSTDTFQMALGDHPIAGDLAGTTIDFFTAAGSETLGSSELSSGTTAVGTAVGGSIDGLAMLFVTDAGGAVVAGSGVVDGVSPARRVALPLTDASFDGLSDDGKQLFVNAIRWAAGGGGGYADTVLGDSPVAYWQFEDSAAATDSIGSTNGTYNGIAFESGVSGQAARWNPADLPDNPGSSNIDFGDFGVGALGQLTNIDDPANDPNFDADKKTSLEFWVKTSQVSGNGNNWRSPVVFGEESPGDGDIQWGWITDAGEIGFAVNDASGGTYRGSVINDNNWHHIVQTFDFASGEHVTYVDGAAAITETSAGNNVQDGDTGNQEARIRYMGWNSRVDAGAGAASPHLLGQFEGLLDEVAIYNTVLSADQVTAHYASGLESVGTNQPVPVPEITGISVSAAGVALQLPAGVTYDIEYSIDLETWTVIASDVTDNYSDADAGRIGGVEGYYRGVVK